MLGYFLLSSLEHITGPLCFNKTLICIHLSIRVSMTCCLLQHFIKADVSNFPVYRKLPLIRKATYTILTFMLDQYRLSVAYSGLRFLFLVSLKLAVI